MSLTPFPIILAPNEIFRKKAIAVEKVDAEVKLIVDRMFNTLYLEGALGLGANMVGVLKSIAIVDLMDSSISPLVLINPEITWRSSEMNSAEESSLSFPGISAIIQRPKAIKVSYLDYEGNKRQLEAEGLLATVVQHEIDYLEGKVFLDYLSKLKRDMLMKKMQKYINSHHHVHNEHCRH